MSLSTITVGGNDYNCPMLPLLRLPLPSPLIPPG